MSQKIILTEEVKKRWEPIIEHKGYAPIKDQYVKNMVTTVLENMLLEAPANGTDAVINDPTGGGEDYATNGRLDPVLVKLVRRAWPALIANDLVGVQQMSGPTGLVFALRSYYGTDPATRTEAFQPGVAANNAYSGTGTSPAGTGKTTQAGEVLGAEKDIYAEDGTGAPTPLTGDGTGGYLPADATAFGIAQTNPWNEMSFSIEKTSVTAKTRALKARYTSELAQDLRAIHGLDAATELSNILSQEIVTEINREVVNTIYTNATTGAQNSYGTQITDGPIYDSALGTYNMVEADGRWAVEKYKMLLAQINYEANLIAKATGRGAGNKLIVTPQVANALDMAAKLSNDPADNPTSLGNTSGVGVTYAGTLLGGKFAVYVDQFLASEQVLVGYKGANIYDAGLFYCPYVPLQMMRAIGEEDFQPRIGFKTRYGMVANPFGASNYYRKFAVIKI